MNVDIQPLLIDIGSIKRSLNRVRSKQLKSANIKDKVRSLISAYFNEHRPTYLLVGLAETNLEGVDSSMQDLLRCTQRDSLKSIYLRRLSSITQSLNELELKSITPVVGEKVNINDLKQQSILETLAKISSASAASYEQALLDLHDTSRKSWRGTAVELREALRELLDVMALDENVMAQPGFKLEPEAKRPTMKQKTVFILKSRRLSGAHQRTPAEAVEVADTQVGKFVRSVYDRSSAGTHTLITKSEVIKIKDYITLALVELLEINV